MTYLKAKSTELRAIAVKVTLHRRINICSLYIPPNDAINENELKNILQQLPTPFILLGIMAVKITIWAVEAQTKKAKR